MYSRSLYVLGATLALFAVISYTLAFTGILQEPGAPSEAPLWKTIGIFLVLGAVVCFLIASLQKLFEQAEERHHKNEHKKNQHQR